MKYGERDIEEASLEPWENPSPERDYVVEMSYPEFTCICPRSGYPDFATIRIKYVPAKFIIELRSLKLYLNSFRDKGVSHEGVTNLIFAELKRVLDPKELEVEGDFNVRGNLKTVVKVTL
ncbi:MAG: NADPH-dependent 7-cyano-7-deazaguanine reductase QueF [Deltaproteobacteria bacterium]|nr:NADPH-dependent 7-cyano-7-deazaguanine reductase QueF [Deltaproteobacteria bacterium]